MQNPSPDKPTSDPLDRGDRSDRNTASAPSRTAGWFRRWSLGVYVLIVIALSLMAFRVNAPDMPGGGRYAGIAGTDGQAYYAFARSLIIDGDLDFQNEFYEFNFNKHGFQTPDFLPRSPLTGRIFNRFPIGFSVFHLPFFLLAHLLTLLGNAAGLCRLEPNGYSALYQLAAPLSTIFYGALAYWTTQKVLRRFVSEGAAAVATFVLFLSYQGVFNVIWFWCNPHLHSCLVFNCMLLLAFRVEDRRDVPRTWAGLGALTGAAGLLRTECLALAFLPLLLFCWRLRGVPGDAAAQWRRLSSLRFCRRLRGVPGDAAAPKGERWRAVSRAAAALAAFSLVFFPQILVWRLMWGEWFTLPMNSPSEGFSWAHPALWQVLVSTRHGLFYWSPVLLIGLAGLVWSLCVRRAGIAVWLSLVPALVLYYIYASWSIWWMGYSFGARQFVVLTVLFGIGLAYGMEKAGRRYRWIVGAGALCLIAWNMAMLWMFLNGHIPRSEGFPFWLPFRKLLELALRIIS